MNEIVYIYSVQGALDRYNRIVAIIDMLERQLLTAATEGTVNLEYDILDDGQSKITTAYRSIKEIQSGMASLEVLKTKYFNRMNGRGMLLRDHNGLRR